MSYRTSNEINPPLTWEEYNKRESKQALSINKSLSISANTALSRYFGLRHIASVKCFPYILLMYHGPGPLHIVWTK